MPSLHIAAALSAALVVGQALMLIALLLADAARRREHRWLALALAGAAASCAEDVIDHFGLARELAWALPITAPGLLVLGPALYLYAGSITAAPGTPRRHAWRHFVPAGALFILSLLLVPLAREMADPAPPAGRPADDLAVLLPVALQLAAYLVALVRQVLRTRQRLKDQVSSLAGRTLNWLLIVAALYGLVLLVWVASWAIDTALSDLLTNGLMLLSLAVTAAFGVRQRPVFAPRVPGAPAEAAPPPAEPVPAAPSVDAVTPKYARSAIDASTAADLRARLAALMASDKPYLEADLTLAELARRIQATPHQLSQVFSQHLGETFFDHVNRHRVEAVKATLARPGAGGRPLLDIALECGFGSKSAFNDTFRRLTGLSPSAYRRSLPAPAPGASAGARR